MQDERDDAGRHHAEHSLSAVPPAVDKHQAHILEVAHGSGEELHQGVGQAIAGQHFHCILLDCGYAPVEGLEKDETAWGVSRMSKHKRGTSGRQCDSST